MSSAKGSSRSSWSRRKRETFPASAGSGLVSTSSTAIINLSSNSLTRCVEDLFRPEYAVLRGQALQAPLVRRPRVPEAIVTAMRPPLPELHRLVPHPEPTPESRQRWGFRIKGLEARHLRFQRLPARDDAALWRGQGGKAAAVGPAR